MLSSKFAIKPSVYKDPIKTHAGRSLHYPMKC